MFLPVVTAKRVNNGKRKLDRMAESWGGLRDESHSCSPSYTPRPSSRRNASLKENPNTLEAKNAKPNDRNKAAGKFEPANPGPRI